MLTRRAMLRSTPAFARAVATPAAAIACSMPIDAGDDSKLFTLLGEYQAAQADLAKAKADLDWLVAEWRHLWPLAPEELLGGVWFDREVPHSRNPTVERDIAGRFLRRDTATLTKRLKRRSRAEHATGIFDVTTAAYARDTLDRWQKSTVRGRTAKSLAKNQKRRVDFIGQWERRYALATEYEAETARLRELSGVAAIRKRIETLTAGSGLYADLILTEPVQTVAGLQAKADFYLHYPLVIAIFAEWGWGSGNIIKAGWNLSNDIARLREKGAVLS
ncbi:hypothetical protein [Mesorhizobium sp. IMUNJ 23232]|uniref:hypothetical protein n=1 Tax=Mesorhizobium sp. IMUNJ 23232 TaxID=3376064 RepID=UPI0037B98546